MKRFCFFLLLLALSARSHAQTIPNGDLETWTANSRAQNWLTTDDILQAIIGFPFATGTTTKSTDAYAGSFAARLESKPLAGAGAVPGSLILGTTLTSVDNPGGLPFTGRPAALQLRYKLSGPNLAHDSAYVAVTLTRRQNGRIVPVAAGAALLLQPASNYALATVLLQYASPAAPDSIHVLISSGSADNLAGGTVLTVDNITVTNAVTAARAEAPATSLTVFPNPSTNGLFVLEAPQASPLLQAPFTVQDLAGRVVRSEPAGTSSDTRRAVDLRGQPAGVYVLHLATAAGPVVRRLVIR